MDSCFEWRRFCWIFWKHYCNSLWKNWFACEIRIPGVLPNQNPWEYVHRLFKQCQESRSLHNSTEYCLNHKICKMLANVRYCDNYGHVPNHGPLLTAVLVKACKYQVSYHVNLQKNEMYTNDVVLIYSPMKCTSY